MKAFVYIFCYAVVLQELKKKVHCFHTDENTADDLSL